MVPLKVAGINKRDKYYLTLKFVGITWKYVDSLLLTGWLLHITAWITSKLHLATRLLRLIQFPKILNIKILDLVQT